MLPTYLIANATRSLHDRQHYYVAGVTTSCKRYFILMFCRLLLLMEFRISTPTMLKFHNTKVNNGIRAAETETSDNKISSLSRSCCWVYQLFLCDFIRTYIKT